MERYRSGHNGADSKSVCAKAHEGSNPSLSAKKQAASSFEDASCFSREYTQGFERSEQNNPVSCFVNGDRRFLPDITKKQNPKRRAKIKNESLSTIIRLKSQQKSILSIYGVYYL